MGKSTGEGCGRSKFFALEIRGKMWNNKGHDRGKNSSNFGSLLYGYKGGI
jgi:hypothetical protein